MNLPNKLTMLRVIFIPVFMFFFLCCGKAGLFLALITFILAAITDYFDGSIARRTKSVTTFGKLMDPMADKLLTFAAFVCFLGAGVPFINAWFVMILLVRELLVTGIRMLALENGEVIAASFLGKLKTVSQFVLIIFVLINRIALYGQNPMNGSILNFILL